MRLHILIITATLILISGCGSKAATGVVVGAGIDAEAKALISGSAGDAVVGDSVGAASEALISAALDSSDHETLQENSPQTLTQIDHWQQLTLDAIKHMATNGLSDNMIIGQTQATNSIFYLSSDQIIDLQQSGVSQRLIDYMIQTGNH